MIEPSVDRCLVFMMDDTSRQLTKGEIDLAQSIFGNSIDYSLVL